MLWLGITHLELRTWTDTVQTGGGFAGGGFGLKGASEGLLEAAVLNSLTTRRREYALLGAFSYPAGGASRRDVVFGFQDIDEVELRRRVAVGVPQWADEFSERLAKAIGETSDQTRIPGTYREIDSMQSRGVLTQTQHKRLEGLLAEKAPRDTLPAPPPSAGGADRVAQLKTLADLRASGALSEDEFQQEKQRLLRS